jgi:predicted ATPase/class 3 adenylate cyclase
MVEVASWLASVGLGHLGDLFRANGIGPDVLADLDDADLKELGLNLGDRKRLLKALAGRTDGTMASGGAPARAAERRQLSVMFIDLVGSTALATRLDPEQMAEVLRTYQNVVAGEITRLEGQVAKLMGDGVLAYFGWPRAHEDEAERSIRAGLAVTEAVSALRTPDGDKLACRVGIATGLVVVGELVGEGTAQEESVIGETPNLAARLQAVARPGAVVVAGATRQLASDIFEFADLGPQSLKGFAAPVAAFTIIGERATEDRFEARSGPLALPMVGRDQELALLLARWSQAKSGEGQAVLLIGEPGIGKSRVTRALLDTLRGEPHTTIRYQCSPYHTDSAFWPVIQQLHRAAGLTLAQSAEEKLDRLEALLGEAIDQPARAAPLFAALLGIDGEFRYGPLVLTPPVQRSRILDALIDQLLGRAGKQPVLMAIEDAHWIDPTTRELVELCLEPITRARVLLILTCRPENQPDLAAHAHVTRLALNRLGRAGVETMVSRLSRGEAMTADVVQRIVARADGVPLFVEELTKATLEAGQGTVPASLQDSLMSRIDRHPDAKDVAQVAACIGREFDYPLLSAIIDRPAPELDAALEQLTRAGILFRQGSVPDARFTFKHALVRDVAYESQLKSRRRAAHDRIAQALMQSRPELVQELPELIAHHMAEAGHPSEAAALRLKAGERALARSATAEAIAQLTAGLEVIGGIPSETARNREELKLQIAMGAALFSAKGQAAAETIQAYVRARQLCRSLGEEDRLTPVLFGLWASHNTRGDLAAADQVAQELLKLAEDGNRAAALAGARAAGTSLLYLGRLTEARSHLNRAVQLDQPFSTALYPTDLRITAHAFLAWTLVLLGEIDAARAHEQRAAADAEQLAHRPTSAVVLQCRCAIACLLRDRSAVEAWANELAMAAAEQAFAFWSGSAQAFRGWAVAMRGEVAAGIEELRAGIAAQRATEAGLFTGFFTALLAELEEQAGHPGEALSLLQIAIDEAARSGGRWLMPEFSRRMAELMRVGGAEPSEVEAWLLEARRLAAAQRAALWELRAATSLARLWAGSGECEKARAMLAPLHDRFATGGATPDLAEARLVLDSLAGPAAAKSA